MLHEAMTRLASGSFGRLVFGIATEVLVVSIESMIRLLINVFDRCI